MSTFTATPDSTQPSSREQAIASAVGGDNTLVQESFSPHTGLRFDHPPSFATVRGSALALVGLHRERYVEVEPAAALRVELLAEGHFD
jgi:hypothetical protein